MKNQLTALMTMTIRKGSIAMVEEGQKNGQRVVELRSKRHVFPEDVINRINTGEYEIRGVYALLRDHRHKEYVQVNSPEGFEPIPIIVVGEDSR